MAPRPGPDSDPLSGVELVLVDGNNLLGSSRLPAGAVIGPIRAAIPAGVRVELFFDGPPRGVTGRLATAFSVRYSGRATADSLILDVVTRQGREHGPAGTWSILVVSDDRELRDAARMAGARSAGAAWLAGRVGSLGEGRTRAGGVPFGRGQATRGGPAGRRGGSRARDSVSPGQGAGSPGTREPGPRPPSTARPKAGTSIGNRRPPRRPDADAC